MEEKGKDSRILYLVIGFLLAVIVFLGGGKLREISAFGVAKIEFPAETPISISTSTITSSTISQSPTQEIATTSVMALPTTMPASNNNTSCFDWDKCWSFDDIAKTMTWTGASNGDIGLRGEPLTKLQSGYTAIITISVPMTIEICKGTLDGVEIAKDCTPKFLTIESGVHRITSAGNQGGFRAYPK